MSALERHVEWTSPATLWDHFNGVTSTVQRRIFRTPAILRFASDSFMDDFLAMMKADPRQMAALLATPEKWRAPLGDVAPSPRKEGLIGRLHSARTAALRKLEARQLPMRGDTWNHADIEQPLKLYQPAHQRYYLVTACLVCRTLGLPDRPLNTSAQERVTFVIRRLQPKTGAALVNPDPAFCDELAFVKGQWTRVTEPGAFADGEEQYPLSPLVYQELDGRRRRILNGLIPVAKRETLVGAPEPPAPGGSGGSPPPTMIDPRLMLLKMDVLEPWARLEDVAILAHDTAQKKTSDDPPADVVAAAVLRANEQIQTIAWYILLDFSKWIKDNIHELWTAIDAGSSSGLSGATLAAYNTLNGLISNGKTLRVALKEIQDFEQTLESVKIPYHAATASQWPSLKYQFVTASENNPSGLLKAQRENLETKLREALPSGATTAIPVRAVAQVSATNFASPWFTVRCVFERPHCVPLAPPVVSDPSASFQLAAFYDSDAPARAIRVTLPADTTPAGLRKFDKNTAFVMSDVMCGQLNAVKSLTFGDLIMSVLPFPLHQNLNTGNMQPCPDGGTTCSFSLPIITICALIVLIIMIKLLDIVFFWMPFFQICLPVPKFDAKGNS